MFEVDIPTCWSRRKRTSFGLSLRLRVYLMISFSPTLSSGEKLHEKISDVEITVLKTQVCLYVHVHLCTHLYVNSYITIVCICIHASLDAFVCAFIHHNCMYMHTCICACICMCIHTSQLYIYMHTCICDLFVQWCGHKKFKIFNYFESFKKISFCSWQLHFY